MLTALPLNAFSGEAVNEGWAKSYLFNICCPICSVCAIIGYCHSARLTRMRVRIMHYASEIHAYAS